MRLSSSSSSHSLVHLNSFGLNKQLQLGTNFRYLPCQQMAIEKVCYLFSAKCPLSILNERHGQISISSGNNKGAAHSEPLLCKPFTIIKRHEYDPLPVHTHLHLSSFTFGLIFNNNLLQINSYLQGHISIYPFAEFITNFNMSLSGSLFPGMYVVDTFGDTQHTDDELIIEFKSRTCSVELGINAVGTANSEAIMMKALITFPCHTHCATHRRY